MLINRCKLQILKPTFSVGRQADFLTKSLCLLFLLIAIAKTAAAQPFSFDNIDFWVGNGPNRAAFVIDWAEGSTEPPALAWGYRWDGEARGRDMLMAIVNADPRLFAKLGGTAASPNAVYGLGYDTDGDGLFGIDDDTTFNGSGVAISGPADGAVATDPGDYYTEGWYTGFWHYGIASSNPYDGGSWTDIRFGMAARILTDGAWDSWTFESTTVPPFNAYAENPTPAPPPNGSPGDFNHDGDVDAEDYDRWRLDFSATKDAADYVIWRKFDESPTGSRSLSFQNVPEPCAPLIPLIWLMKANLRRRNTNRRKCPLVAVY